MSIPASSQGGRSGVAAERRDARHHDRMSPPGRLRDRMSPPGGSVTDLAAPRTAEVAARPTRRCVLDIVIPVHNEEHDLAGKRAPVASLSWSPRCPTHRESRSPTTPAPTTRSRWPRRSPTNCPTSRSSTSTRRAAAARCTPPGSASEADVVAYMDVDLSTDLSALMPLVAPLISGHSDVAIGSRLAASSRVVRGPKREFVSRSYNLILRGVLGARFSDAQCGFKAIRADVARQLLPLSPTPAGSLTPSCW